jgi:hypothetical protein
MVVGIQYRVRQFWRILSLKIDQLELEQAKVFLSYQQRELFTQLQTGEQNHALAMYRKLLDQGENQPDLLVATLLHDVGKLRYRMNPLERSLVVLAKAMLPEQARRWGELPHNGWERAPGWRKSFVVAQQHPAWGAEMAREAGVSCLAESLIRKHHDYPSSEAEPTENSLLNKLRLVDNDS